MLFYVLVKCVHLLFEHVHEDVFYLKLYIRRCSRFTANGLTYEYIQLRSIHSF